MTPHPQQKEILLMTTRYEKLDSPTKSLLYTCFLNPINQKTLNPIFTSFQINLSKESSHGSRTGLPIVANSIESHIGSTSLQSDVGKGTVFYFTVPT